MKTMKLPFLLLLVAFLLPLGLQAQKIYLVSVGISDYPGSANDLNLPANDARVIQWVYQKNKRAKTILLQNKKATAQSVISAMNKLYQKAGEKDIIVFFFSGHGAKGGSFVCYDRQLSYDEVRRAMAKSKSRHKMIFADACYAGKMRQEGSFSQLDGQTDYTKVDIMLFLSSRSDETSIERASMKNGFFTAYLQRALKGGADVNRDRVITARELFDFVSKGVKNMSNDRQHPVMWGNFDQKMPVMMW